MTARTPIPPPTVSPIDGQGRWSVPWYGLLQRTLSDNGPVITPQMFGATADGVANDSTALQAAIDEAQANGQILLLLPGTYLVSRDTIDITSAISITGTRDAIIKNADADGYTLQVHSNNVSLTGFTIDGGNSSATVASGYVDTHHGLYFFGADSSTYLTGCVVDGLEVKNCGYGGIQARYIEHSRFVGNYVHRCGYVGIGLWSPLDCHVSDNYVIDIYPGSAPGTTGSNCYGIAISRFTGDPAPDTVFIDNNYVYGITWEGLDEHDGMRISFTNNKVIQCGVGIAVEHHISGFPATIINVENNQIYGLESVTIESVDYRCTGGIVCNGGINTDNGTALVVNGNLVENAGDRRASPGDSGAIKLQNWSRFQVNNNVCYFSYRHGIIFATDGTDSVTYGTVNGNTVTDTQTVGGVNHDIRFQGRTGLLLCADNFTTGSGDGCTQTGAPTYAVTFADNLDV